MKITKIFECEIDLNQYYYHINNNIWYVLCRDLWYPELSVSKLKKLNNIYKQFNENK